MTLIHRKGEKMNINLPIKIHNRFEIEVKNIDTGEIVQKGYAENIVLNNLYSRLIGVASHITRIQVGSGTGELSAIRTTLFNRINGKAVTEVETVLNQPPTASYRTTSIAILPAENVGATITEVGLAFSDTGSLVTHALIKDSEGNPLTIGPKTDTQEITIYSTIYGIIENADGIDLPITEYGNSILNFILGRGFTVDVSTGLNIEGILLLISNDGSPTNLTFNYTDSVYSIGSPFTTYDVANKNRRTGIIKILTNQANGKVKSIVLTKTGNNDAAKYPVLRTVFPNALFEGWEFDKTHIGVGDGSKTVFFFIMG